MKQHIDILQAIAELRADDKSMLIMITEIQSFIRTLEMMSGVYIFLSMAIISLLIYIHKTGQKRQEKTNEQLSNAVAGITKILSSTSSIFLS